MNPIKALGWLVVLGILTRGSGAEDLAISSPTLIEIPSLVAIGGQTPLYGAVGASGTNAAFVWTKAGGDGTTNLFFNRLNEFGRAIDAPPRLVASEFYLSTYSELYPAKGGYFLRYFDRTNRSAATARLLVKGIDFDGNSTFAPVVISTNLFKEADTASNGRSLLLLVENYHTSSISLDYTIVGPNGKIVSTGRLAGASGGHSFAAASDGRDFIAVWTASAPPYLRVTRFSGIDGSLSTTDVGTNVISVQTMAHGKNGYLVAGGPSMIHLSDSGTFISKIDFPAPPINPMQELIFPEGEGWILFTSEGSVLRSRRVTPTPTGLSVADNSPYAAVSSVFSSTFTPPMLSTISPFGAGKFLVVRDNGVSLLTKTAVNYMGNALDYAAQNHSDIVASPFGYLVVWTETRGLTESVRALRFAPDGSPLDNHSFEVTSYYARGRTPGVIVFDGKDYVVSVNGLTDLGVARISPQGAPDLRLQSYAISTFTTSVNLTAHKGELFASFSSDNIDAPFLLTWKLGADGQAGPEVDVHDFYLVTDGENLLSVGVKDKFQVFKIALDLAAPNPEISTNILGVSPGVLVKQLRHGFVASWATSQDGAQFAYFSKGQERLRANLLTNTQAIFADTEERLLMDSSPIQGNGLSRFDSFNLQTGERTFIETDLGKITKLHIAGATEDFLAVTESFNPEFHYVEKFWITTAKPPALAAPQLEQYRLATTLNLNPRRRYRIETSSDLVDWDLQQVVGGLSSCTAAIPWNEWESPSFIRAVLVPE